MADRAVTLDVPVSQSSLLNVPPNASVEVDFVVSVLHNITPVELIAASKRVLHAGDNYDYQITAQYNGSAKDLTDAKVWLTIKRQSSDSDDDAVYQKNSTDDPTEVEIDGTPTSGIFTIHFLPDSTADLEGVWVYDIQIKDNAGDIMTLARGNIEFLSNLTRATS